MHRPSVRFLTRCALALVVVFVAVAADPSRASAHNTLLASDPANGSVLATAPSQITWVFDNEVPLETLTVTVTDASGSRTEAGGSTHGPAGATEVVTPLPSLGSGAVSVRWRLVGPDGHPITGRVDFSISPPATSTATSPSSTTVAGGGLATSVPPTTVDPAPIRVETVDSGGDGYSTPGWLRWTLRYASYVSIMAVVGITLTAAWVWDGAARDRRLRRLVSRSLIATAALGAAQLLVIASDVSGRSPLRSLGSVDAATTTDAGMALAIRVVLAAALWVILFRYEDVDRDVFWTASAMAGIGLLATWAFAGHSRSMRWPELGVVADVAHHAAAATWIAGLAIVALVVIPEAASVAEPVRRFSRVAAVSVAVLVVTGLAQSARLVGSPLDLFDGRHGRLLAAKLVALAAMLGVAAVNRRRVVAHAVDAASLSRPAPALRRAMLTEFAIGLAIVGITAAMVVTPPATAT